MLDVVLQILSVLGIILLVLLGLLLAVILLTLFFPVIYRVYGEGKGRDFSLEARASWLFGLLRVCFAYPDPGKLTVKVLWFTVLDSEAAKNDQEPHGSKQKKAAKFEAHGRNRAESSETKQGENEKTKAWDGTRQQENPRGQDKGMELQEAGSQEKPKKQETEQGSYEISRQDDPGSAEGTDSGEGDGKPQNSNGFSDSIEPDGEEGQEESKKGFQISEKLKKIKYTFCGICDKIKKIWQNITYYVDLLQDRETRLLFLHVKSRVWKILKSIHPRKLRAQILFGTGSPDTTGYAYGVYGMLLPLLGPDVIVTPDFCEAVFEGSFYAAGHVTMAVLIWHTIRILFDRRLKLFWDRLKNKDQDGRSRDNKGKKGTKRKQKNSKDKTER